MNSTLFALSYLYTNESPTSLPEVKLFASENMAYESLFLTLAWRFVDAYPDLVAEQMSSKGCEINPQKESSVREAVFSYANENGYKSTIELLSEWEDGDLLYSIKRTRTGSFIEEAIAADLLEIDDYSIRNFYAESEQPEDPSANLFLEASTIDDDSNSVSFEFTYNESTEAMYDFEADHWVVKNGNTEHFISFRQFK
ncbi:hypothetical protein OTK49_03380 [Vibrio coralliirubri]|uniref:hypothetical protein n=1 Tax=Vibrio coralliirubri TaxID=1516159 RepID=UPI002284F464|nr:hypothetical protein [Vibrio coralliirubri]MCY9861559.1 hypothetical protein [Vibrio coralliirubri]